MSGPYRDPNDPNAPAPSIGELLSGAALGSGATQDGQYRGNDGPHKHAPPKPSSAYLVHSSPDLWRTDDHQQHRAHPRA